MSEQLHSKKKIEYKKKREREKFAGTHRELVREERTVRAAAEDSGSRDRGRETHGASAFLPALAW